MPAKCRGWADCVIAFLALCLCISATEPADSERAVDAYEQGDYVVARLYFQNLLDESDFRQFHADAAYYLAKIHDREADFISFFSVATRFLEEFPYDMRASEIFLTLLEKLYAKHSYVLALDYLAEYSFLVRDDSLFEQLGHGLLKHGEKALADSVFSLCPQSDTIKIIRAHLKDDYSERSSIFEELETPLREIYLGDNYLLLGDTLSAYFAFQEIDYRDLADGALYRYAKMAVHFDHAVARVCAERLSRNRSYANKAEIIESYLDCRIAENVKPEDEEELELYLQVVSQDTVWKGPPQDVMLDSLLRETGDTVALMRRLSQQYKQNYYIDSSYCQTLVKLGRYSDAARVISPYLEYCNTRDYVRKILGIQQFSAGDYKNAAKNIIISNYRAPVLLFMLAESYRIMGHHVGDLYEQVISQTSDSSLYRRALAGMMRASYTEAQYEKVCTIDLDDIREDTALIRLYARSLARCGRMESADSLYHAYFTDPDPVLLNYYGLYLVENEAFTVAEAYYDSVMQSLGGFDDELYYNWALTAFLKNEMEIASERFAAYLADHPKGERSRDAFFKIATLNYLEERYDSAAHYYILASEDESLKSDALRNALISHKKAGDWFGVISVGQRILASGGEPASAEILFDIGYAFLRGGRIKEAVENIGTASRLKSDPRFFYWLGEAHLGKGDFARAFHYYQKVIELHADDEMWVPTAQYKTGIVLELMDETDAARSVYRRIVRERGVADPIGAEANIRLQQIEP